ncbi:MAG TPA: histidine phosphatase family protein [Mycobacteriales bacterium]|nr:histidine phosphatase family protein [Mycobacteriales bacterium]
MPAIFLVRHGETAWSRAGRHTGLTDVPLTHEGEAQARALAAAVQPVAFALVLTSPLARARRTAELAGLHPPARPDVQVEPGLAEWDYGGYEGRTTAEISTELGRPWTLFADGVRAGETPGESLAAVAARAEAVLDRVRPVLAGGGNVALVGHGHQLRVLTACWLGVDPGFAAHLRLAAGTLSRLDTEHDVPAIDQWNVRPPAR